MSKTIRNMFSVQMKSVADFERFLKPNGNGGGLFFHTDHELKVGELVTIKASVNNLPNPIFLSGWVAWRRLRPRGSRLPRGVFVTLAQEEKSRMEGFVKYMDRSPEISIVRAYPRFPVFLQAHYLTDEGPYPATTRNLSIGGAFLKCDGPLLPAGSRTSIMLNLEEHINRSLELVSEVVRFEPLAESPSIAVRFEPGQANLSKLAQAIKQIRTDLTRHTVPYLRFSEQG